MTSLLRALIAFALIGLWTAPAAAQIIGRPLEFSAGAGWFGYDSRARVDDGLSVHGRLGWRAYPWMTLETSGTFAPSSADTFPAQDHNFVYVGADVRWDLRNSGGRAVPFILTGVGVGHSHTIGHKPDNLVRGAGNLGLGLLVNVMPRAYLRMQVRDVFFRDRDAVGFSNHIEASAALQFQIGGRYRDEDFDGVRDWLDKCPDTPIGAKVDAKGCPSDSDGDGVFDGLDKCDATLAGCVVDDDGCPVDSDGDGVCDGIDMCADTPNGKEVNAQGCPVDMDGDGVKIPNDKCEDTAPGCQVDATGCSTDSDGDGICDGVDECPNTPQGVEVGTNGCPINISPMEQALIDSAVIRLTSINFASGRAELRDSTTFATLDEAGVILQQYPMLFIEVGGHTDSQGGAEANQRLSEARANAVWDYLRTNFALIDTANVSVNGYGPTRPIAPNTTSAGRAMNRRVEFKVLNPEVLQQIRQRRQLMKALESEE